MREDRLLFGSFFYWLNQWQVGKDLWTLGALIKQLNKLKQRKAADSAQSLGFRGNKHYCFFFLCSVSVWRPLTLICGRFLFLHILQVDPPELGRTRQRCLLKQPYGTALWAGLSKISNKRPKSQGRAQFAASVHTAWALKLNWLFLF